MPANTPPRSAVARAFRDPQRLAAVLLAAVVLGIAAYRGTLEADVALSWLAMLISGWLGISKPSDARRIKALPPEEQ